MKDHSAQHDGGAYRRLAVELTIDFVIMYFVMYTMIESVGHLYLNVNNVYMTLMMVAPMTVIMLVSMRSMFPSRRINLAVGAGLAAKLKKSGQLAATFFGDGGANRGTVHEGMNMAAIWKLPVIFVCEYNQYASTTPASYGTSVANVSSRAQGYDMPSAIVNGNDVFAVNEAAKKAIEYVRSGKGPYMLEFKTYRVKGHFVGDPEMYRSKQEVHDHFENDDPIKNFAKVVLAKKWLTQKEMDAIHAEVEQEVATAVEDARKDPYPAESELFNDYYVEGGVK